MMQSEVSNQDRQIPEYDVKLPHLCGDHFLFLLLSHCMSQDKHPRISKEYVVLKKKPTRHINDEQSF